MNTVRKLKRLKKDRLIGGVAGGLGEYFDIDPVIFRLLFVLFFLFGGSGLLIYIFLWLIIPVEDSPNIKTEEVIKKNVKEIKEKAESFVKKFETFDSNNKLDRNNKIGWGLLFVSIGLIFLIQNFIDINVLSILNFEKTWPILLILIGSFLILKKK